MLPWARDRSRQPADPGHGQPRVPHRLNNRGPVRPEVCTEAKGSRSRNTDKARRPSPLERCERGERAGGPREEKRERTRALLEAGAPARLFLLRGGESAQPRSCTHRTDEAATALPALSARPLRPPRPRRRRPPGPTSGPPQPRRPPCPLPGPNATSPGAGRGGRERRAN